MYIYIYVHVFFKAVSTIHIYPHRLSHHAYSFLQCALPMKTRKRVNIAVNRAPIDLPGDHDIKWGYSMLHIHAQKRIHVHRHIHTHTHVFVL